jgi:fructose-1,6-bisphosphatase
MKPCYDWNHQWVASTANNYEICQLCKAVRKKQTHVLPPIEKKEENTNGTTDNENGRAEQQPTLDV